MDDPLSSLAVALAAAGGNELLSSLQLSEAQRSLGMSPHLVFLAGVALALPAQVDGGGATFTAEQERTFARLQITYGQACRHIDGAPPPHPTRLYKLSPLLVPAQPLSIAELLRVSTPPADPTASSEEGASPAAPAPAAPAPAVPDAALAAACAAAAAAAAELLAEEIIEERRSGTAASVPSLRAKPKARAKPPKPKPPRERQADQLGRGDQSGRGGQPGRGVQSDRGGQPDRAEPPPGTSERTLAARERTLADLAAPPLREIDAEAFDAAEWTEVAE